MNFIIPYQYNKTNKTHIESTVLTDKRLSDKSVRFLLFITNLINFNALKLNIKYTNISYRKIEEVLKYSRNKIKNSIDELLKTEYLYIERTEGKKSKYFLKEKNFKDKIVHNLSITKDTGINSDTGNTTVNYNGSINSDTTTGINSDTTTGINSDTTQDPYNTEQESNRPTSTHQYTKFSTPKENSFNKLYNNKQEKETSATTIQKPVFRYYKDFLKTLDPEFKTVTLLDTNKITYKVYYHETYKYDYKTKKPYPVFKVNIQIGSEVFSIQDFLEHTHKTDTPIKYKYSFLKSFIEAIEKKDRKATEGYLYNFKSFHKQYLQQQEEKEQKEKREKTKTINEVFEKAGVNFENFTDPSVQSKQEQLFELKRSHPQIYERVKRSIKIDERRLNFRLSHEQRTIRELNLFNTYLNSDENKDNEEKEEDKNKDEFDNIQFERVLTVSN